MPCEKKEAEAITSPVDSDRIKRQRFWYLLERKLLGTGTGGELHELDEMAEANHKAYDTIVLVDRLWQFRSADQMDEMIRKESADGHEVKYLWPVRVIDTKVSQDMKKLRRKLDRIAS